MAAATIKHGAHRIFGGHHRSLNKSDPVDVEQREKEKQVITDFLDQRNGAVAGGRGGSPASLARVATLDQRLGLSSRQLGIKDFKLLKTLGTGPFYPLLPPSENHCRDGSERHAAQLRDAEPSFVRESL